MSKILDSTIGALNTSMNLRMTNQNVIAANIANADTPGYKAKSVDFEGAFREALGAGDGLQLEGSHPEHRVPRDTDPIDPEIFDDPNDVVSLDGNTVDRAEEMAKLSQNELLYKAAVELSKKKLGMLKYAISEGGGNR